jgi:TRAP-type mannitol/chloroaromatic compound transport system substrate-binding protein
MPASHLACRKGVWDSMPINHQSIIKAGMQSLALESNAANEIKNAQTIKALLQNEVTLYKWSNEALGKYRSTIKSSLTKFATTKEAKKLLSSHIKFLKEMGVLE